ncbi:MAG: phosphate ABC transporter substrate-binding protein PstS [Blastocatellia bacterium AA13]|nr:MAG: phosphate ABC transporter substrate-binding protein PstS [Blastocatellia bacterium AA13]
MRERTAVYLRVVYIAVFSVFLLVITSCGDKSMNGEVKVQGAGATFPYPLYQEWFSEYNKSHSNVKLDYSSIGSGGGINQITSRTVDFGGSDAPMTAEQLKAAPGEILHIPTVLGAVVITYNLPSVTTEMKLTSDAVAGIFLGKITKWSDAAISASNPGVTLPDSTITVIHRSDGSGTSFVFTDYLSKVSQDWKDKVGAGTSVQWPAGGGEKGNEGVTGRVKGTPNSIGYVELIYAQENKLPVASIKNGAGNFVKPSLDSTTAAAASVSGQMPDDLRVSITNAPGADAYPIASFTYLLAYKEQEDERKGKALVDFMWWAIHDGEKMARGKLYAPLPDEVVKKAEAKVKSIVFKGKPLLQS